MPCSLSAMCAGPWHHTLKWVLMCATLAIFWPGSALLAVVLPLEVDLQPDPAKWPHPIIDSFANLAYTLGGIVLPFFISSFGLCARKRKGALLFGALKEAPAGLL
eukprot:1308818-Prymnesium_polylepis.1